MMLFDDVDIHWLLGFLAASTIAKLMVLELNTDKCKNLSASWFLVNNDLNITLSCFDAVSTQKHIYSPFNLHCDVAIALSRKQERVGELWCDDLHRTGIQGFPVKHFGFHSEEWTTPRTYS
jgi:hypothetical protein